MRGTADHSVSQILELPDSVKVGCVKVYGEWLGRPWESQFSLSACNVKSDSIELLFDEMTVVVDLATELTVSAHGFSIDSAASVWVRQAQQNPEQAGASPAEEFFENHGDRVVITHSLAACRSEWLSER